jgi:hypothetical protein
MQHKLRTGDPEPKPWKEQVAELVGIAETRKNECEKKSWKFRAGQHEIVLRDLAVSIVGYLSQIGDIATMFAPPQAKPPWRIVRAVMQVELHHFEVVPGVVANCS